MKELTPIPPSTSNINRAKKPLPSWISSIGIGIIIALLTTTTTFFVTQHFYKKKLQSVTDAQTQEQQTQEELNQEIELLTSEVEKERQKALQLSGTQLPDIQIMSLIDTESNTSSFTITRDGAKVGETSLEGIYTADIVKQTNRNVYIGFTGLSAEGTRLHVGPEKLFRLSLDANLFTTIPSNGTAVTVSPDESYIAYIEIDTPRTVKIRSIDNPRDIPTRSIELPETINTIGPIQFSPNGMQLALFGRAEETNEDTLFVLTLEEDTYTPFEQIESTDLSTLQWATNTHIRFSTIDDQRKSVLLQNLKTTSSSADNVSEAPESTSSTEQHTPPESSTSNSSEEVLFSRETDAFSAPNNEE